ncbi:MULTISPECIES: CsbD family protein [Pectobacterium]|uniref:Stress-response protein n=2 Tax=Pectobacterium TaxID=122277 RepID=A0AA93ANK8_9GAMM|nr:MULTISPECIES: stress-response protein [Pectobacterium]MDQ5891364.1 hypothetical protein [Pseudomonadota bacterium]PLY38190.1 stress-response protein [Pectobacterium carotovorum]MBE5203252.1 stress-response protein [Pectobacterium quasiaquaticum]MBE5211471.1 stress-response protein [Pectobacterium quasiaquaticum]MBE5221220.1 stress-response protein [Pectobacterium quasiaquaticum]
MNSDIVVGKWKQWKGNFLALCADWFDSDCAWLEGSNDYLSGVLQEGYGKAHEEVSSEKTTLH